MRYAKLINNQIQFAPRHYIEGGYQISNPTPEMLIATGYKPVTYADPPEVQPGYIAVPGWEEMAGEIVQVWTVELAPVSESDALTRYSNELTGASDETLEEATETLLKIVKEVN